MITGLGDCLPASGPLALVAVWKCMGGFQTCFWEDLKRGLIWALPLLPLRIPLSCTVGFFLCMGRVYALVHDYWSRPLQKRVVGGSLLIHPSSGVVYQACSLFRLLQLSDQSHTGLNPLV